MIARNLRGMNKSKDTGLLGIVMGIFLTTMLISILMILLKQSNHNSGLERNLIRHEESEPPDFKLSQSPSVMVTGSMSSSTSNTRVDVTEGSKVGVSKCSEASAVQICSHRGKGGPPGLSLVQSIEFMAREGVFCLDIDVFSTEEGLLLVGRPSDLIEQLRTRNHSASQVHEVSWKTLKSHSLDRHYPILLDVLHTFKTAVHRYHRYRQPVPVLLIELKGQAMSHQSLAFIAQQSQMAGLLRYVHIWVKSVSEEALILQFKSDRVHLLAVRCVPDSVPNLDGGRTAIEDPLSSIIQPHQQLQIYSAFGPSINNSLAVFTALKKTVLKRLIVWVVDSEADLRKSLDVQANIIITNDPKWLKSAISSIQCPNG